MRLSISCPHAAPLYDPPPLTAYPLLWTTKWCSKRDSNPHGFLLQILSLPRLPITPFEHLVHPRGLEPPRHKGNRLSTYSVYQLRHECIYQSLLIAPIHAIRHGSPFLSLALIYLEERTGFEPVDGVTRLRLSKPTP